MAVQSALGFITLYSFKVLLLAIPESIITSLNRHYFTIKQSAGVSGLNKNFTLFQIEREVILSTADKNSKIPILHDYVKRTKVAIAPDVPPKQMAAWTVQGQILGPDQVISTPAAAVYNYVYVFVSLCH